MHRSISAFGIASLPGWRPVCSPRRPSAAPRRSEASSSPPNRAGLMTSDTLAPTPQLWCLWDCNYARTVVGGHDQRFVTRVSGPGPGTLAMDITRRSATASRQRSRWMPTRSLRRWASASPGQTPRPTNTARRFPAVLLDDPPTTPWIYAFEVCDAFIGRFQGRHRQGRASWESSSRSPRPANQGVLPAGSTGPQAYKSHPNRWIWRHGWPAMLPRSPSFAVESSTGARREGGGRMMAIFGALLPRFALLVGWSNDPAGWQAIFGSPVWFLGDSCSSPGRP